MHSFRARREFSGYRHGVGPLEMITNAPAEGGGVRQPRSLSQAHPWGGLDFNGQPSRKNSFKTVAYGTQWMPIEEKSGAGEGNRTQHPTHCLKTDSYCSPNGIRPHYVPFTCTRQLKWSTKGFWRPPTATKACSRCSTVPRGRGPWLLRLDRSSAEIPGKVIDHLRGLRTLPELLLRIKVDRWQQVNDLMVRIQ